MRSDISVQFLCEVEHWETQQWWPMLQKRVVEGMGRLIQGRAHRRTSMCPASCPSPAALCPCSFYYCHHPGLHLWSLWSLLGVESAVDKQIRSLRINMGRSKKMGGWRSKQMAHFQNFGRGDLEEGRSLNPKASYLWHANSALCQVPAACRTLCTGLSVIRVCLGLDSWTLTASGWNKG